MTNEPPRRKSDMDLWIERNTPPEGYTPIIRHNKIVGGFHKKIKGKWATWYPADVRERYIRYHSDTHPTPMHKIARHGRHYLTHYAPKPYHPVSVVAHELHARLDTHPEDFEPLDPQVAAEIDIVAEPDLVDPDSGAVDLGELDPA